MLWYYAKKINAAFGRLRERRESVGDTGGRRYTPEEEAAELERNIMAAEASGDIASIVHLLAQSAKLTTEDYVKKTVGNVMFLYYMHMDLFKSPPRDIDDLVDGMLFMQAKQYIREQAISEAKANASRTAKKGSPWL